MIRLGLILGLVVGGFLAPASVEAAPRTRTVRKAATGKKKAGVRKLTARKRVVRKRAGKRTVRRTRPIAPPQPVVSTPPPAADPSGTLAEAYSFLGVPYRRGGSSPSTGFDCSGFVQYVFRNASGVELPRSAMTQFMVGEVTVKEALQPADLVFFRSRRGWHVGIYAGNGNFIHSPNSRDRVKVTPLDTPYYAKTFLGARRIFASPALPVPEFDLPSINELPAPAEILAEGAGDGSPR
jgi:cell wall-associated NlpC family hydrolase